MNMVVLMIMVVVLRQASGGDIRAGDYGDEDGDGGGGKGDGDLHADDYGGEDGDGGGGGKGDSDLHAADHGDCGGKDDGGDGGEGDKHQFTCSSYRHLAMILWPGYYDTEVTIYLDSQYSMFIEGSDAKLGNLQSLTID